MTTRLHFLPAAKADGVLLRNGAVSGFRSFGAQVESKNNRLESLRVFS